MTRLALVLAAAGALLSGCSPRQFAGLLPLEPASPDFTTTSPNPEVCWQELPSSARLTEVVYDVKVYDSRGLSIAEKEGLTEPRYRLEKALTRGLKYEWTVRARYRFDGARRRTEWTEREDTWIRDGTIDPRARRYVPLVVKSDSE
jgi:hypothetical protein